MKLKRRTLKPGQEVVLLYHIDLGFIQEKAVFKEYRLTPIGNAQHRLPVFDFEKNEITGLQCFWILPSDPQSPEDIERLQKNLIAVQIKAIEIGLETGYEIPRKFKDGEIEEMAMENYDRTQSLIQKFGFDPRDESWIEVELADNEQERHWFAFERANGLLFASQWTDMVQQFNQQYNHNLDIETAKVLSKKRLRYLLGAYHIRMRGDRNVDGWKEAAKTFETQHRMREERMLKWSQDHQSHFPLARTKEPVSFWYGPYFNQCVERIPDVFTDTGCQKIKTGVLLRVVSYDPQDRFICLDFTPDIRTKVKTEDPTKNEPWKRETADYEIWVRPSEIDSQLEILGSLE